MNYFLINLAEILLPFSVVTTPKYIPGARNEILLTVFSEVSNCLPEKSNTDKDLKSLSFTSKVCDTEVAAKTFVLVVKVSVVPKVVFPSILKVKPVGRLPQAPLVYLFAKLVPAVLYPGKLCQSVTLEGYGALILTLKITQYFLLACKLIFLPLRSISKF